MIKRFLVALLLVLLTAGGSGALESTGFPANWNVTYFGTTDQDITVSWDHNDPMPKGYEVVLFHVEREQTVSVGTTVQNTITFRLPRSGHFVAKVRAFDVIEGYTCAQVTNIPEGMIYEDTDEGCKFHSPWSESTDKNVAIVRLANGDVLQRGWWIYGHVASPGDIIINR